MATQAIDGPLTQFATFLIVCESRKPSSISRIRDVISDIGNIAKNVSIRHPTAALTCTVGVGSSIWDRLTRLPRPAQLHPFPEIRGGKHVAVSTPGDLLFHIRSERRDVSFEF